MHYIYEWHFEHKNCKVNITPSAVKALLAMAVNAKPNETGGTLVGYYTDDALGAHIEIVLEAQAITKRSPCTFIRPSDEVDTQLAEIYNANNGKKYYLGEWHTHPNGEPLPSNIDMISLVELAKSPNVATDNPILLIVGGDLAENPEIMCYIAEPNGAIFIGLPTNE